MSLPLLASLDDVTVRLARALSDDEQSTVLALLADASATIRGYTRQDFTAVEDDEVTLTPMPGGTMRGLRAWDTFVRLPQRPVTDVTAVVDPDGDDVDFEAFGELVGVATYRRVTVTYDHGYAEVPDDIRGVCSQMATRALGVPADDLAKTSETIMAYSYTIGTAAASGGFGMLQGERQALDRYRRRAKTVALS